MKTLLARPATAHANLNRRRLDCTAGHRPYVPLAIFGSRSRALFADSARRPQMGQNAGRRAHGRNTYRDRMQQLLRVVSGST